MSRRTVLSRPRTRLYDANYNIGESYYRPAIDRLDRKYSGRPLSPPPRQNTALGDLAERHARVFANEDLDTSRRRAEKHIREEHLFDSRGARIGQRTLRDNIDNEINDETAATLKRIRASKKVSVIDDVDLENTSNNLKTHRLLDRSEKILDSVGISDNPRKSALDGDIVYKRRALKVTFDGDSDDLTKWTPLDKKVSSIKSRHEEVSAIRSKQEDNSASIRSESSAAIRARQSREKINDIEEEMTAMAEKQAAREARVARLRALVAETEQDSEAFEASQTAAERISARREMKAIQF